MVHAVRQAHHLIVRQVHPGAVHPTVQEAAARPIVRAVHLPGVVVPIPPPTQAVHHTVEDVPAAEADVRKLVCLFNFSQV